MPITQEKLVAIVTGAASGIGKAVALEFAKAGYQVFLIDNNKAQLLKVLQEDFLSLPVSYHCGDVSVSQDVQAGFAKCLADFGRVDVLVANAAILKKVSFLEMREEQWDRMIAVNLKGVFLWGQAVASWMVWEGRQGKIINIACTWAELTSSNLSAYSASKGGVKMLTKAMAVELAPFGITVNAIEPGRTMTEGAAPYFENPDRRKNLKNHIPLKRFATPEDIANVTLFLASDKAQYMTGAIVPVDGGYTSKSV